MKVWGKWRWHVYIFFFSPAGTSLLISFKWKDRSVTTERTPRWFMETIQAAESARKIRENQGKVQNTGYGWVTRLSSAPRLCLTWRWISIIQLRHPLTSDLFHVNRPVDIWTCWPTASTTSPTDWQWQGAFSWAKRWEIVTIFQWQ